MTPATPGRPRIVRALATTLVLTAIAATSLAATTLAARDGRPFADRRDGARATGMTFTYTVSSSSSDKRRREAMNMNAMVRMQDGKVRMDYTNGASPMGQKDGYVVIDGKAGVFSMVSPKDKAVMVMDAGTFGSGMGAVLNSPMMKMTMSNMSFRFKDMGAGDAMLGYSTRRVRLYNTSTVELKVMGMTRRTTSSDSSDQWVARGVEMDDATLQAWSRSFSAGVKATNPELATELERYQKEYARSGMALRTVTWSTQTDEKGKVQTDSLLMQVTDIRKGAIDNGVFVIPSDYTVTNLGEAMTAVKASMDSAKRADAAAGKDTSSPSAKGVAKEAGKESAKDAIKSGLGGLLKKKKGA